LTSTVGNVFAHQGLPFDHEKGSCQNRHREYAQSSQRFAQRDPAESETPLHLYAMRPNSIAHVDPFGLNPFPGGPFPPGIARPRMPNQCARNLDGPQTTYPSYYSCVAASDDVCEDGDRMFCIENGVGGQARGRCGHCGEDCPPGYTCAHFAYDRPHDRGFVDLCICYPPGLDSEGRVTWTSGACSNGASIWVRGAVGRGAEGDCYSSCSAPTESGQCAACCARLGSCRKCCRKHFPASSTCKSKCGGYAYAPSEAPSAAHQVAPLP
jgi:RHS repeat-associated protein